MHDAAPVTGQAHRGGGLRLAFLSAVVPAGLRLSEPRAVERTAVARRSPRRFPRTPNGSRGG
jgi:hypothetical protein